MQKIEEQAFKLWSMLLERYHLILPYLLASTVDGCSGLRRQVNHTWCYDLLHPHTQ